MSNDPRQSSQDVSPEAADAALVRRIRVVPSILRIVCDTTGMGFAAIGRMTDQTWTACAVLDRNGFGLRAGGRVPLDTTFCRDVGASRRPIVIEHASLDPAYAAHPAPRLYGFESYIAVPIILTSGEVFGTICAFDPKPTALLTTQILPTMQMFAELVVAQIEAEANREASRTALMDTAQVAMLREQFIAVLDHDLRNPAASLSSGLAQLERTGLDWKSSLMVGHMQQSCRRLAGLIDDTLDLVAGRLGAGILVDRRQTTALEAEFCQTLDAMRRSHPERDIVADIHLDRSVRCDPARIGQLLSNLLANALAHGAPDTPVLASACTVGSRLMLSVSNAGSPIPVETMDRLFEPFIRGMDKGDREGLGLGLFIASQIARAHGGTLEATTTAARTTFTFTMPNPQIGLSLRGY
jgi:signal transduction histidine kinase